jgi:hypothetical protein
MTKAQFWTLNLAGGLCALLIAMNLILAQINVRMNKSVAEMQGRFNQAQRLQNTAQSLVVRIAESSQKEPSLRDLLVRHKVAMASGTQGSTTPSAPPPSSTPAAAPAPAPPAATLPSTSAPATGPKP